MIQTEKYSREKARPMKYDSVIIGFGKGGKTLAAALAGRGEKVAVIEKSNKIEE